MSETSLSIAFDVKCVDCGWHIGVADGDDLITARRAHESREGVHRCRVETVGGAR